MSQEQEKQYLRAYIKFTCDELTSLTKIIIDLQQEISIWFKYNASHNMKKREILSHVACDILTNKVNAIHV